MNRLTLYRLIPIFIAATVAIAAIILSPTRFLAVVPGFVQRRFGAPVVLSRNITTTTAMAPRTPVYFFSHGGVRQIRMYTRASC